MMGRKTIGETRVTRKTSRGCSTCGLQVCLWPPHLERVFYIIFQAFVVRIGIGVGNGGRGFGRQPDKGDAYSLGEAAGATFERAFGGEEAGAASTSPALSRF